jgi:DNA-directed RNA polymerase subunit B'
MAARINLAKKGPKLSQNLQYLEGGAYTVDPPISKESLLRDRIMTEIGPKSATLNVFNNWLDRNIKLQLEARPFVIGDKNTDGGLIKLSNVAVKMEPGEFGEHKVNQTPRNCRDNNITYSNIITATATYHPKLPPNFEANVTPRSMLPSISKTEIEESKVRKDNIVLGKIPVMLRSKGCILDGLSVGQRLNLEECPNDPGCYFIIEGGERSIVTQESLRTGLFMLWYNDETGRVESRITCVMDHGTTVVTMVPGTKWDVLKVGTYHTGKDKHIPLYVAFMFLEYNEANATDLIAHFIPKEYRDAVLMFLQSSIARGRSIGNDIVGYMTKKMGKQKTSVRNISKRSEEVIDMMQNDLFGHIKTNKGKARALAYMAAQIFMNLLGKRGFDNRDSWAIKKLSSAGRIMEVKLNAIWTSIIRQCEENAAKGGTNSNKMNIFENSLPKNDVTTEFIKAFTTTWSTKQGQVAESVTDSLKRDTPAAAIGQVLRISAPTSRKGKKAGLREVNQSQLGMICVSGNTLITMRDGYSVRRIDELEDGDCVTTTNLETFESEPSEIYNHFSNMPVKMLEIETISGRKVACDPEHPFFVFREKEKKEEKEERTTPVIRTAPMIRIEKRDGSTLEIKTVPDGEKEKPGSGVKIERREKAETEDADADADAEEDADADVEEKSTEVAVRPKNRVKIETSADRKKREEELKKRAEESKNYTVVQVKAKDLKEGDRLFVRHQVKDVRKDNGQALLLKMEDFDERYWKELDALGYFQPLSEERMAILARMWGAVLTDGHLEKRGKNPLTGFDVHFCVGAEIDVKEIRADIEALGFVSNPGVFNEHTQVHDNGRKITHRVWLVRMGGAFGALMFTLGMPSGNKTMTEKHMPDWIFNGSDNVRREFLSGIAGGDGSRLYMKLTSKSSTIQMNHTFQTCAKEYEGSHKAFMKKVVEMYKDFGIETSIKIKDSDRGDKKVVCLCFGGSMENLNNYADLIIYRYCIEKRAASALVIEFLKYKLTNLEERRAQIKIMIKLSKEGKNYTEIGKLLGVSPKSVSNYLRKHRAGQEIILNTSPDTMNYNPFWDNFHFGDEIESEIVLGAVKKVREVKVERVYDFTTVSNNHCFYANGLLVSNCQSDSPEGESCVPASTLVLLDDGRSVSIKDLIVGSKVACFDILAPSKGNINSTYVTKTFSLKTDGIKRTLHRITSISGQVIDATDNHPFLTPKTWVETKNLQPGDFLATVPWYENLDETVEPYLVLDETIFRQELSGKGIVNSLIGKHIRALRKFLFPLTSQDKRLAVIARMFGYIMGAGLITLAERGYRINLNVNFNSIEDGKTFVRDIQYLGFAADELPLNAVSAVDTKCCFKYSGCLISVFAALGIPIGKKFEQEPSFLPNWITQGSLLVKREFLAGLGDLDKDTGKVREHGDIGFDPITITVEERHQAITECYMGQILQLYTELGITNHFISIEKATQKSSSNTTISSSKETTLEKSLGEDKGNSSMVSEGKEKVPPPKRILSRRKLLSPKSEMVALTFTLTSNPDNMLCFTNKVGLRYSHEKSLRLQIIRQYYKYLQRKEGSTLTFCQFMTLVKPNQNRTALYVPIEKIERIPDDVVYDIKVQSQHHSFIASEYISHNCGLVKNFAMTCNLSLDRDANDFFKALKGESIFGNTLPQLYNQPPGPLKLKDYPIPIENPTWKDYAYILDSEDPEFRDIPGVEDYFELEIKDRVDRYEDETEKDYQIRLHLIKEEKILETFPHPIFFNGNPAGWCKGEETEKLLRIYRQFGVVSIDSCIFFNNVRKCLEIDTSGGRCIRPLLAVDEQGRLVIDEMERRLNERLGLPSSEGGENTENKENPENKELIRDNDTKSYWDRPLQELLTNGCMVNIDAREQEKIMLAQRTRDVREYFTKIDKLREDIAKRKEEVIRLQEENKDKDVDEKKGIDDLVRHMELDLKEMLDYPYTHSEIHPIAQYGNLAGMIPEANKTQGPRITYQASMGKQALNQYHTKHMYRFDSTFKVMVAPSLPVFQSEICGPNGLDKMPAGDNLFKCYYGHPDNPEDGIVTNRDTIDAGKLRMEKYITHKIIIKRGSPKEPRESAKRPPPEMIRPGDTRFHAIGRDGLPAIGAWLNKGDCIVAKLKQPRPDAKNQRVENASIYVGVGEEGWVERISINRAPKGTMIKIKMRQNRDQIEGDKLASRYSQKGTISRIVGRQWLPRVACGPNKGMVADLYVNPHAVPSRMPMGEIDEMIVTKAALYESTKHNYRNNKRVNATTFEHLDVNAAIEVLDEVWKKHLASHPEDRKMWEENKEKYTANWSDEMKKHSPFAYGYEIMEVPIRVIPEGGIKGDGPKHLVPSGRYRLCRKLIYMGPCFIQVLRHQVRDKYQVRAEGTIDPVTHQPIGGRAREGGQRLGEMERDALISHGATAIILERLMKVSDGCHCPVCQRCGNISIFNTKTGIGRCGVCLDQANIGKINVPYVFLFLKSLLSLASIHVSFITKPASSFGTGLNLLEDKYVT